MFTAWRDSGSFGWLALAAAVVTGLVVQIWLRRQKHPVNPLKPALLGGIGMIITIALLYLDSDKPLTFIRIVGPIGVWLLVVLAICVHVIARNRRMQS